MFAKKYEILFSVFLGSVFVFSMLLIALPFQLETLQRAISVLKSVSCEPIKGGAFRAAHCIFRHPDAEKIERIHCFKLHKGLDCRIAISDDFSVPTLLWENSQ